MDKIDTLIFCTDVASVGTFRCPQGHERFGGGFTDLPLAVFPRTSVVIEREHVAPVFADPNTVVFYNAGDHYRRTGIDVRGDHCDYFALRPELALEIAATFGHADGGRLGFGHGPASAPLYVSQRSIVTTLSGRDDADPVAVEEAVMTIFTRAAELAATLRTTADGTSTTVRRHESTVRSARQVLVERAAERISLADVAGEVAVSPYHLSRIFRRYTGFTVHGFLTQLRLRSSLEHVTAPDVDLATLALELGFSSHSHFTSVFRTTFGSPPSAYRKASGQRIDDLRKILTV